ncbi:L-serine ammonia-lyase [Candidimonas humi]|uniref:L-serine dehydratase n=1 Tax=Candidimonas humi TaxID=683355 RepID=A0ABV8NS16_9BURK|nr:L-serine ammonia-lyase [Candidimonas humi]MBV6303372.1 L-serine ammonia-lyase [Candidimonas humi]
MTLSIFDIFKIGIGPSSSHTVGPMRAARNFARSLQQAGQLPQARALRVELYGSLAATGRGHGTDRGIMLGLMGEAPDTVDPERIGSLIDGVRQARELRLWNSHPVAFDPDKDFSYHLKPMTEHPNGMRFSAFDAQGQLLRTERYLSIGGGFIQGLDAAQADEHRPAGAPVPYPFENGAQLMGHCDRSGLSIAALMRANECVRMPQDELEAGVLRIARTMNACVDRGCGLGEEPLDDMLPGPLKVRRRAPALYRELRQGSARKDPLHTMDWVNVYAMAVNEENAAGGRVVTAPTNGAAGLLPAVLRYYQVFVPGSSDAGLVDFLLTAAAIAFLYKRNASISGAEVGCQGEVGVACSMAAAGLAAVSGGTPHQVENAAEIGMEHNLGLTCDPIGGLVQIPCIERNAMGAVKAINAARLALQGDGTHHVSLDAVIETMRQTGADMRSKYKETSRGGLAVNVVLC